MKLSETTQSVFKNWISQQGRVLLHSYTSEYIESGQMKNFMTNADIDVFFHGFHAKYNQYHDEIPKIYTQALKEKIYFSLGVGNFHAFLHILRYDKTTRLMHDTENAFHKALDPDAIKTIPEERYII